MSENQYDLKLSVSKTKTFDLCKKQYQFVYVHKLPTKDFEHHIFGKFCHKILENFHNLYINGSQEPYNTEMTKSFKDALEDINFKGKITVEMKKEAFEISSIYLKKINDRSNFLSKKVLASEKKFNFNIKNKILLNGFIDRIQLDDDNILHVADYKTTKNKKYLKEDWFQLKTYAYILFIENPDIEKVRASYVLLRHDFEHLTKEFNRSIIPEIENTYINYVDKILSEKEFLAQPSFLCNYCSFLDRCIEGQKQVNPDLVYGEVSW